MSGTTENQAFDRSGGGVREDRGLHRPAVEGLGAVLGLSGGLDSAVVAHLCVRALFPEGVLGLILPERDSDLRSLGDARKVARELWLRMIMLYQRASRLNYAVVGTANRSEWEAGHYDRRNARCHPLVPCPRGHG
ncbi:MAG: NH(3)-dependent NAD(+) synthetase [Acetothermia bacterium 64_32]|nr:MAG: NH(3)-dependent NAD(+) synthetase [Acetothermia bacterium 64_32]